MADANIYRVMDLALRVGEILLYSGAGAADVTATVLGITQHYGLRHVDIDITFTRLGMSYQDDPEEIPMLLSRSITSRDIDYDDLTRTHLLIRNILSDTVSVAEARRQVAWINSSGARTPRWAVSLGSGVLGGGITLILGGGPPVVAIALLASTLVDVLIRWLNQRAWPMFYQQAAGGLLATVVGLVATSLDTRLDASLMVTASIVLLLSGIGFLGSIQDALTGFYLTAAARSIEALLATAGLITGVSAGLALAPRLHVSLSNVEPSATGLASAPIMLVGAIVAGSAFAFTCYAPLRSLVAVAMATVVGHLVLAAVQQGGVERPWSVAAAALAIGLVSYTISGRVGVPPLVVVVPALVPMLPGLLIYRGLSSIADGQTIGILRMASAAAITIALSAGVILGEYISQPLKRNARRVERRLRGPRLVGLMHTWVPTELRHHDEEPAGS